MSVTEKKPRGLFKASRVKEDLASLDELLAVQLANGNWNYDDYMMGLANGMILSRHVVADAPGEPEFRRAPTLEDARALRDQLGPGYADISLAQLWQGVMAELKEHGDLAGDLDVIPGRGSDEWLVAARIAASHLLENPIYYTELQKIEEFTIYDLRKATNQVTTRTYNDRKKTKGAIDRGVVLTGFDASTGILEFLVEPTYQFSNKELDYRAKDAGTTNSYRTEIQLSNYRDWVSSDADQHGSQAWKDMQIDAFKELLQVVDIKLFCSCPSFSWVGMKYQLTNVGASIYPQTIPDAKWSKRTGSPRPSICKHCAAVLDRIIRFPKAVLKEIQAKV